MTKNTVTLQTSTAALYPALEYDKDGKGKMENGKPSEKIHCTLDLKPKIGTSNDAQQQPSHQIL